MSEKRFVRKNYSIWDNLHNKELISLNYRRQSDDLCELLNSFYDEIEELKKEKKFFDTFKHNWKLLYDESKNKVEMLRKENIELNNEVNDYIKLYKSSIKENDGLQNKLETLEKIIADVEASVGMDITNLIDEDIKGDGL